MSEIKDLILVVEDSKHQAAEIVDTIADKFPGYAVEWADSINAGLRIIEQSSQSPEIYGRLVLVLTDLGLPMESGGPTEFDAGNVLASEEVFKDRIWELGLVARVAMTSGRDDVKSALEQLKQPRANNPASVVVQPQPLAYVEKGQPDALIQMMIDQLKDVPKLTHSNVQTLTRLDLVDAALTQHQYSIDEIKKLTPRQLEELKQELEKMIQLAVTSAFNDVVKIQEETDGRIDEIEISLKGEGDKPGTYDKVRDLEKDREDLYKKSAKTNGRVDAVNKRLDALEWLFGFAEFLMSAPKVIAAIAAVVAIITAVVVRITGG